jgi:hypothetical protein
MKLFGQLIRTVVNVALLPVAVAKDALTLGGVVLEQPPAIVTALKRLKEEAEEATSHEPT